jgi:23S rRNA (guanosine2251-2'-O)-methyltransferase
MSRNSRQTKGAVVYGFHAVAARIRHRPESIREILVDASRQDPRLKRLFETATERDLAIHSVAGKRLDDLAGSGRHQGVVALVDTLAESRSLDQILDSVEEAALILVLDGVTDPHNLGACLRVADALGAHAIVAPKDRAVGMTATVEKVASGAAQTVPYVVVTNLARELRALNERGVWTVGASQGAQLPLGECDFRRPVAVVLGAEGKGLRRLTEQTCDELVAIPMMGTVESLNVSVATGICLYEARRQRNAAAGSPD